MLISEYQFESLYIQAKFHTTFEVYLKATVDIKNSIDFKVFCLLLSVVKHSTELTWNFKHKTHLFKIISGFCE